VPTNHGGAQWPEPPMASYLPIFMELPLTPVEDEHQQGATEPDLQRSLLATAKLPRQTMNHDTRWRHLFSHSDWMSGKARKTGKKWG
jgi:hypothetical protein